jgi:tetratricopeptide (TPR) repeat protein
VRTNSNRDLESRLDRYARGELTARESRELAQASLNDPELFAELTDCAIANAALASPVVQTLPFPRPGRRWVIAASAAAAVILILIPSLRSWRVRTAVPSVALALDAAAKPGQPLLLSHNLRAVATRPDVFRAAALDSRPPRRDGSIVSVVHGVVTLDLGSLDGVVKGGTLEVLRGVGNTGRLQVTTVFREQARARAMEGIVKKADLVQVPPAAFFDALLQQVDAFSDGGDLTAARATAEQAIAWAQENRIPAGNAFERLGSVEYRSGQIDAAEKHYRAAVDANVDANGVPAALNALGVIRLLRGDSHAAAELFTRALPQAQNALDRASIANNLGVIDEMRGDRHSAKQHYADALRSLADRRPGNEQDWRAVATNADRVAAGH